VKIPFEAECTACADVQFKINYDKRKDRGYQYPHDPDRNLIILQKQFEDHLSLVHAQSEPVVDA
jgi:hypothetical protein